MIKNIIKNLTLISVTIGLLVGATVVVLPNGVVVAQNSKDAACEGLALTGGGGCDTDPNDPNNPNTANNKVSSTIATVINLFSLVVGVVAVIMIIIGGFKYVISNGDSNNINSAKNTILYALIGLVIVAMSQVIVRFVLNEL
jgi:cytochrome bd-type quinol oxidase subunit 2